ncbi:MAG: hypothetical protein AAGN35_09735 [Bacteroidota bacterium]
MKVRLSLTALLLFVLFALELPAQNEIDALRFSSSSPVGTARALGAGGAFSAVGADFSAASLNPAGLALYRRNDLMFTPTLRVNNTQTDYVGRTSNTSASRFGISNFGYVYAGKVAKWNPTTRRRDYVDRGLKSYSFSFGFNQTNNFRRNINANAFNPENSITDYFAEQAQGSFSADLPNQLSLAGLAWNAYAIDSSGFDGNYIGSAQGGNINQRADIFERGRANDWTIGLAGNVSDIFYIGGGIGIHGLRYEYSLDYREEDLLDVHNTWSNDSVPFSSLRMTDGFTTRGSGLNLKIGMILRPVDFFRVGISFTSPTWYSLTDNYTTDISGFLDGDATVYESVEPLTGVYSYNLATPYRVTAGAMLLLGKLMFISADFEYIDYTTARFSSEAGPGNPFFYDFQTENNNINQFFTSAYNLRLGTELRLGRGRLRAGYANYGAVLRDEYLSYVDYANGTLAQLPSNRHIFTGGLGYKSRSFYIDVAYVRDVNADRRLLYTLQDATAFSPELVNRNTGTNLYMTIGFTF